MKNLIRNRRGFTLIEVLVVMIIIGILAAIAIPNFIELRNRADGTAVKAHLKDALTVLNAEYAGCSFCPSTIQDLYDSGLKQDDHIMLEKIIGDSPLGEWKAIKGQCTGCQDYYRISIENSEITAFEFE